jgi:hypothetical protein
MNVAVLKKNWYFLVPGVLIALPALVIAMYMGIYGYTWSDALTARCISVTPKQLMR